MAGCTETRLRHASSPTSLAPAKICQPAICRFDSSRLLSMSSLDRKVARARTRPPRSCIFCGGGSLSREHVWPRWAAELLPDAPGALLTLYEKPVTQPGPPTKEKERNRQGSLKSHRVRAVCRSCNSGWMSRLEESVRPVLTPLIVGAEASLSASDQELLFRWLTLKVMVAEHDSPELAAITQAERRAFYEVGIGPPHLRVWLFSCGAPPWNCAYYRHSATMWRLSAPPPPAHAKNLAFVTFGSGDLLAVAVYDGPRVLNLSLSTDAGVELAPPFSAPIHWPLFRRISADEALRLAQTLDRFAEHPNIQWADDPMRIEVRGN